MNNLPPNSGKTIDYHHLQSVPLPSTITMNSSSNLMVGRPSPLVEPPPLEVIKYSSEKGGEEQEALMMKQFSALQLVDMEKSPSARLINNNLFQSSATSSSTQQQPLSSAVYGSTLINIGMMNPLNNSYANDASNITQQQVIPPYQQLPIEKPPQFLFDKNHFENLSSGTITKTSSGVYTSVFVNSPLGALPQNKSTVYKWNVKINTIKSWLAIGVSQTHIGDAHKFSFSPYDEHGAYMLSANGYIWDRQLKSANKYEYVANSNFVAGDLMSLELSCGKRELIIHKNGVKVATVHDIQLPVYPSFMMHGTESVEFMGMTESQATVQELPVEFVYQNYHMTVEGRKLTKKTKDVYHTVFFKNLLGDISNYGIFKWRIKILSTSSWIGLGVVAKEIADGRFHNLSPYDNHGGYIYSINGYGWSAFYEGPNKYNNCGASCSVSDVITLELNCASKELTLSKNQTQLISFKNVHLPVYPIIMMHSTESVEVIEMLQEGSYQNPDAYKFDGVLEFKHNPEVIENVGCKIRKLTESGYSNVYVNKELSTDQIIKRYKIKINKLASWVGIGVIKKENTTSSYQSYSPYDNNGAFIISGNGYVWDSNMKDPKYKLVEAAKFVEGDIIILEMNCITRELNFYKNIITNKMATIENVTTPVYPFVMLYGKEELEFLEYLDNTIIDSSSLIQKPPSFKYSPSSIKVSGRTVTKTTTGSYANIFVDTPLGLFHQSSSVFKWQVKVVAMSWLALGVSRRDLFIKNTFNISPYDDHCSYFLSANGYVWNRQLADPYYLKVEGSAYAKGDVLVFTLDCKNQSLQIEKNGVVIARIDNIRLPVYPSFLMYDAESVEFSWI